MAYIDREKLAERIKLSPAFKKFHRGFESEILQNVVLDLIDNMPTADVVEVVRCHECRWFVNSERCGHPFGLSAGRIIPDNYCCYGERK